MDTHGQREAKPPGYYDHARPEIQALVPTSARRILDVGCASGMLGHALKCRQPCTVTGIEYNPQTAETARTRLDFVLDGDAEGAEILDSLSEDYFDCVICADVLEHLRDPARVLRRISQCLRPDGLLIASIPNIRHWSVVQDLLEGRWTYKDEGILDRTHLRFFTKSGICSLLAEAGFQITRLWGLPNGPGAPAGVAEALAGFGMDTTTLREESIVYQYLTAAAPIRRRQNARRRYDATPEPAIREPVASMVMLTRNQIEYTRMCVESLFAHTCVPFELIVVDNGSTDGTVEEIRQLSRQHTNVHLIANENNLGFAAGNNQGMATAAGEYIVLINNDLVFTEGWLERLIACTEDDPAIGLVGPCTNHAPGPQQLDNVQYPGMPEMHQFAARLAAHREGMGFGCRKLVGFCLLIKREVIDTIGGLDVGFGIGNFEDDDFCLRARAAHFRCWVAADCFVHHFGSKTFTGEKINHSECMVNGWNHFKRKWGMPSNLPMGLPYPLDADGAPREMLKVPLLPDPLRVS